MRSVEKYMAPDRFGQAAPRESSDAPSVQELFAFERMLADISARLANVPAEKVESEIRLVQVILRDFSGLIAVLLPSFRTMARSLSCRRRLRKE